MVYDGKSVQSLIQLSFFLVSTSLIIDLFWAQGIIEDPMTKIERHSCQNLTSEELVTIANTAKKVKKSVEISKKCGENIVG